MFCGEEEALSLVNSEGLTHNTAHDTHVSYMGMCRPW